MSKYLHYINIVLMSIIMGTSTLAFGVDVPEFLPNVEPEDMEEAGQSVWVWVVAGFILLLAVCSVGPAILAIKGERERAKDLSINILYGAGLFIALPAIAVGVVVMLAN